MVPKVVFYRQFSITMSSAIILSGFVSLTLTPSLCALILTKEQEGHYKKSCCTDCSTSLMPVSTRVSAATTPPCRRR